MKPMATVATPMISRVRMSIFLRPSLSPKCPKMMPPMGRATKPMAKVAKARMVPRRGSTEGKYSLLKNRPATTP